MAESGINLFNHFRDGPKGFQGVTGGGACPVGAGWGPLGGAGGCFWFTGVVWGWKDQWFWF